MTSSTSTTATDDAPAVPEKNRSSRSNRTLVARLDAVRPDCARTVRLVIDRNRRSATRNAKPMRITRSVAQFREARGGARRLLDGETYRRLPPTVSPWTGERRPSRPDAQAARRAPVYPRPVRVASARAQRRSTCHGHARRYAHWPVRRPAPRSSGLTVSD